MVRRSDDPRVWLFTAQGFPIGYIVPATPAMKPLIIEIYKNLPSIEGEDMVSVRDRFLNLLEASAISCEYFQIQGLIL